MMSTGKKALLILVMVVMTAAVGFIIHTSRQAASARDHPNCRARQIEKAAEDAARMLQK